MSLNTIIEKLFRRRPDPAPPRSTGDQRLPADMPVPLLAEIVYLLGDVTAEDVTRARNTLGEIEAGDKLLGRVRSHEVMRVYALYFKLGGRAAGFRHRAEYECDSVADKNQARSDAERWTDLSRAANILFWISAKDDVGDDAWWADASGKSIGLRAGFSVVAFERLNPMAQLMGGLGRP